MKVIIAGSRTVTDIQHIIIGIRNSGFNITEVVCGMANGADALGKEWAILNNIHFSEWPAEWRVNGILDLEAGFKRNKTMGDYADALVAIWDGASSGTKDMIQYMKRLDKPYYVHRIDMPETTSNLRDLSWLFI